MSLILNRLKVWQKLALLAVLGALLVAVPLALLVRSELADLELAQHQAEGIAPLRMALGAIRLVQQHRGLSAQTLAGRNDVQDARKKTAQAVAEALAALDANVRERADDALLTAHWRGRLRRADNRAAPTPSAASSQPTRRHVPGADKSGSRPNPPRSEPKMEPAVFQAYASPSCRPTCSRPRPSSAISKGNCTPAAIAGGSTTSVVTTAQPAT